MNNYNKNEVERILRSYNADHDLGPDCPVTWREERLAQAVLELSKELEALKIAVQALQKGQRK